MFGYGFSEIILQRTHSLKAISRRLNISEEWVSTGGSRPKHESLTARIKQWQMYKL